MRNRQHRRALVLAVTATLTASAAGLALPAAAAAPTPAAVTAASKAALLPAPQRRLSASERELMRVQEQIDAAATRVEELVRSKGLDGYSGVEVSARTKELILYWHGPVPASMTALILRLSTADVHVVVRAAAYSLVALRRAAEVMRTDPLARAARVTAVSISPDGSGITVHVPGAPGPTGTGGNRPALPAVPVRVTVERAVAPVPLSGRWADVNPYWGGSMTLTDGATPTTPCSAGWPMHFPDEGDQGYHIFLTAEHCGFGTYRTPPGDTIGVSIEDKGDLQHDTRTIDTNLLGDTPTRMSGYAIYTGAVDQTGAGQGETAALIAGAGDVKYGDLVFTSGAFSGERGSLRVTNVSMPTNAGTVEMIQLEHTTSTEAAAGGGDSGGPVYRYDSATGNVVALGTISSGDPTKETFSCPGVTSYRGVARHCYNRIWVSNIHFAMNFYGALLNTA